MWDRRGQFGKAEDEGRVHRGDEQGRDGEAEGAGAGPAIAPSEIFARNDEADGDRPKLERCQTLLEFVVGDRTHMMAMRLFHICLPD